MKTNKFALQIALIGLLILSLIACDKDFASIESDIINEDNATNFDNAFEQYNVITYTKALNAVQTNNLGLNTLGVFDDNFGRTTSSFVTQLTPDTFDPEFADNVNQLDEVKIDSVVLSIPYFSTATAIDEENGTVSYDVDSIIGRKSIRLEIFRSNYFLRNFDPNGDFNEAQAFFSNKSASTTENISDGVLEGEKLTILQAVTPNFDSSYLGNDIIEVSDKGFVLTGVDDDGMQQVTQRLSPGIRLRLDPVFWKSNIINRQGDAVLESDNSFAEYFRGLYFKAQDLDNDGSFLILNPSSPAANITIYYKSAIGEDQQTFVLRFGQNRVNFIQNDFNMSITDGDDVNGDARIFLKGGEGALGRIKLFNGDDIDDGDDMTFEDFKNSFVDTDEDGKFVKSKRLINEANLIFYVDQNMVGDGEPNRIFIYDAQNKTPLVDYFLDGINNGVPSASVINHLGPLQRVDDEFDGKGIKYKLKITEHINNLLLRDSTNVDLGIAVSLNVNLEELLAQREVQTADDSDLTLPISSILTPRGTVLHGSNTEDESKRVYLEIYYTEPNN